jgi:hypothetical protein
MSSNEKLLSPLALNKRGKEIVPQNPVRAGSWSAGQLTGSVVGGRQPLLKCK